MQASIGLTRGFEPWVRCSRMAIGCSSYLNQYEARDWHLMCPNGTSRAEQQSSTRLSQQLAEYQCIAGAQESQSRAHARCHRFLHMLHSLAEPHIQKPEAASQVIFLMRHRGWVVRVPSWREMR